jgi:hypothetical protein
MYALSDMTAPSAAVTFPGWSAQRQARDVGGFGLALGGDRGSAGTLEAISRRDREVRCGVLGTGGASRRYRVLDCVLEQDEGWWRVNGLDGARGDRGSGYRATAAMSAAIVAAGRGDSGDVRGRRRSGWRTL